MEIKLNLKTTKVSTSTYVLIPKQIVGGLDLVNKKYSLTINEVEE
jgi:hypothetical protein